MPPVQKWKCAHDSMSDAKYAFSDSQEPIFNDDWSVRTACPAQKKYEFPKSYFNHFYYFS